MNSRRVVFFNAYACDPEKGGEPGLGWNWLTFVGRRYPLHLTTADRGCNEILLDAIKSEPELKKNVSVTFLPWKLPEGRINDVLFRYLQPYYYLFYRKWMAQSYSIAQRMCTHNDICLVHQNTYHSFREPGDFWRLPVPSIWAPVAGISNIPWRLLPSLGAVEGMRHGARNLINLGHKRFNQRFRRAVRGYSKVIAGSEEAASFFRRFRPDIEMIPGQLIRSEPSQEVNPSFEMKTLQLVFCGYHFSRKGGGYLIQAFAQASCQEPLHLDIIGEGPMTSRWKDLANRLGCSHKITWHGRIERAEVTKLLTNGDVFVFPSVNDCFPTVIAEALSAGLPIITTNIPGVGDMVNENCGILIPASSARTLISSLVDAILRLARSPTELNRLRRGVIRHRDAFLFETRMKRLEEMYDFYLHNHKAQES